MASCFKNGIILCFLALLGSCGQDGVAPILELGISCDELITQDTDSTTFVSLLQAGASASEPFTVCIDENVTVGSATTRTSIDKTNVQIVGLSQTTSALYGLNVTATNPTLHVRNLTLKPLTSGMYANYCFNGSAGSGVSTFLFDEIICSAPSVETTMDRAAFVFFSSGTGTINLTFTDSVITSSRAGISTIAISGGTLTSTITGNTMTVGGAGIKHIEHSNSVGVLNYGGNTLKFNGAGGGMDDAAFYAFGHTGGTLTINDISGSRKNFACRVTGSSGNFTSVFFTGSHSGTVVNGTFSAAGTQNGGNTINNCP